MSGGRFVLKQINARGASANDLKGCRCGAACTQAGPARTEAGAVQMRASLGPAKVIGALFTAHESPKSCARDCTQVRRRQVDQSNATETADAERQPNVRSRPKADTGHT